MPALILLAREMTAREFYSDQMLCWEIKKKRTKYISAKLIGKKVLVGGKHLNEYRIE